MPSRPSSPESQSMRLRSIRSRDPSVIDPRGRDPKGKRDAKGSERANEYFDGRCVIFAYFSRGRRERERDQ